MFCVYIQTFYVRTQSLARNNILCDLLKKDISVLSKMSFHEIVFVFFHTSHKNILFYETLFTNIQYPDVHPNFSVHNFLTF